MNTTALPTGTENLEAAVHASGRDDRQVVAGGIRFHYREWGPPEGPAVLLLHGLTGNAYEWDPIAAVLASDLRVLAIEQRGHGQSDRVSDYGTDAMVADLEAIAAVLGLDSIAVVGHSMGGLNGLLLAARRPDLVERLAIVDVGPESMNAEASEGWRAFLRAAGAAAYAEPDAAVAEWREMNPLAREPELRHFIANNLRHGDDGQYRWRFDASGLEGFLDQRPEPAELWGAVDRAACPLLVVNGDRSEVLDAATAERMARGPRRELVVVPDGAHDLTVEQPGALTEAIRWFLRAGS
jgi:pimeloyl-ACP methyl ester carboxylesterase